MNEEHGPISNSRQQGQADSANIVAMVRLSHAVCVCISDNEGGSGGLTAKASPLNFKAPDKARNQTE